jgi:hypothetical protein
MSIAGNLGSNGSIVLLPSCCRTIPPCSRPLAYSSHYSIWAANVLLAHHDHEEVSHPRTPPYWTLLPEHVLPGGLAPICAHLEDLAFKRKPMDTFHNPHRHSFYVLGTQRDVIGDRRRDVTDALAVRD